MPISSRARTAAPSSWGRSRSTREWMTALSARASTLHTSTIPAGSGRRSGTTRAPRACSARAAASTAVFTSAVTPTK